MYKDRVRNARTNIAFNLARDLTRASYRSISITEKTKKNMDSVLNGEGT